MPKDRRLDIERKGLTYFVFVDEEDYPLIAPHRWHIASIKRSFYASTTIKGKTVRMHRLILGFPDGLVDHKNRNGLDNRQRNLRVCSYAENRYNVRKKRGSKSPYKGVTHTKEGRYIAYVNRICCGTYSKEKDAALAYDAKAKELHGEYAKTNF